MLLDCHCHLHDREFFSEKDAESFLKSAKNNGISGIICIGTTPEDSEKAKIFAKSHKNVFYTFGIHPEYAEKYANLSEKDLESLIDFDDEKLVALGEIGLDYHYSAATRENQIKLLEKFLSIAEKHDIPVSFHIREAFDDFFGIIKNFPRLRAVVHSFSDNKKNLRKLLETTDFYIGVNGLATYSTLPTPPLDRIILETDAPFLTPVPNRGKINQPAYILDIAKWLSKKLELPLEEIEEKTTKNGRQLFDLPDSVL